MTLACPAWCRPTEGIHVMPVACKVPATEYPLGVEFFFPAEGHRCIPGHTRAVAIAVDDAPECPLHPDLAGMFPLLVTLRVGR